MATTKKSVAAEKQNGKIDKCEHYARVSLSASTMSAVLSDSFTSGIFTDLSIAEVSSQLSDKIKVIQNGDTKSMEAMLFGQAQALQTMFVSLGRKAAGQSQLPHYIAFMNLALKAQSQSRATIQALTELKYPKQATFVKQANISNGNQQVNNANSIQTPPAHAKEIINQPNELLEANNDSEKMDGGTAQTTIYQDKAMEALATQHRP